MTKPKQHCIRHDRVADYPNGSCLMCREEDEMRQREARMARRAGAQAKKDKALAETRRVQYECVSAILRDFAGEYPTKRAACEEIIGAMFTRWGGK